MILSTHLSATRYRAILDDAAQRGVTKGKILLVYLDELEEFRHTAETLRRQNAKLIAEVQKLETEVDTYRHKVI